MQTLFDSAIRVPNRIFLGFNVTSHTRHFSEYRGFFASPREAL